MLAGTGILLVALLAILVSVDATDALDRAILDAIRAPGPGSPLDVLDPITELGSTAAVTIVAALTLLLGVAAGPWRHGVLGAVTIGIATIGVEAVKAAVARTRPEILEPVIVERGFSFPSGHATLSMTAYGILAILIGRSRLPTPAKVLVEAIAAVVVGLVGLSRVWLGVHYPSDVLAGWIAGAVVVVLFADLTRGVSKEPAAAAVDAGPGARRSDPPAAG
jgi:undecaprenyl-diphosphatase